MAEEKKKRFRPSLGAYRALENEVSVLNEKLRLSENEVKILKQEMKCLNESKESLDRKFCSQLDGTSALVSDCDLWREKYQSLFEDNKCYASSNSYMEHELDSLREKIKSVEKENDRLRSEMLQMEKRGFWSRVFNTK